MHEHSADDGEEHAPPVHRPRCPCSRRRLAACPRSCRSRSRSSPRRSSPRRPTCRGRPTPTAARRSPSSPAGPATSRGTSRTRPPPPTQGYLRHILEVGHLSVLEHGTVTMYLTGVSRSLTHELIRHRHFSYSQLSQRYVPERDAAFVEPAVIAEDPELHERFLAAADAAAGRLHRPARGAGEARSPTSRTPRCAASRPARPPARCCPTPPRRGSSSPATTAPGGTSSRCGPASTPTSRSASSPSPACASCSGWPATSSTTSGSARWPTAPRSPPARYVTEG